MAPRPSSAPFHGTILVADDEAAIRSVTKKMLQLMGFEVLTARDGREALDGWRQKPFDMETLTEALREAAPLEC